MGNASGLNPNEWSAVAELTGDRLDRLVISPTESLHKAIAQRVFTAVPIGSGTVRPIHDGIAGAVYRAVRHGVAGSTTLAAAFLRAASSDASVRPLSDSRRGRFLLSAINGLMGDRLEELGNELSVSMAVRWRDGDVACDAGALRRAFPHSTPRLAVFLHGLAGSDEWWTQPPGSPAVRFGTLLRRDLGVTPVWVRYNTGLRISENGRRLAALLESLTGNWPVAITDLVLIGHSMGGLVARSAGQAAVSARLGWPTLLRHIVTLGTPHHGVPLEKAVHLTSWALRIVPEAAAFADILDARSVGIRDLGFGNLCDEDWSGEGPGAPLCDQRTPVPPLKGCGHTFVGATVTKDPNHPVGWLVGDLAVRTESSSGRSGKHTILLPPGSVVRLGGLHHLDLLGHPVVYAHLRAALEGSLEVRHQAGRVDPQPTRMGSSERSRLRRSGRGAGIWTGDQLLPNCSL